MGRAGEKLSLTAFVASTKAGALSRIGEIGRRSRFKTCRGRPCESSNLSSGTSIFKAPVVKRQTRWLEEPVTSVLEVRLLSGAGRISQATSTWFRLETGNAG